MSYSPTGTKRLSVAIGLLSENDEGRKMMAHANGFGTKVLDEPPGKEVSDAGVILVVVNDEDQSVVDQLTVSWALWDALSIEMEARSRIFQIKDEVGTYNTSLSEALKSTLNEVENLYAHDECGTEWTDSHSCEVDTECPSCQADCSPVRSDWKRHVDEDENGIWRLYREDGLGDKEDAKVRATASP